MKRILMAATAAVGLLGAVSAASAQTISTGTVVLNGTVTSKCSVVSAATSSGPSVSSSTGSAPGGANWGDTINLGELADASGVLRTNLDNSTQASPSTTTTAQLACTGANMGVSVTATPLTNSDVATAPSGYSRLINFTTDATFKRSGATSSNLVVTDSSAVAGATTGSFGSGNFLAATSGNVSVSTYNYNTDALQTDLLTAGAYSGQVVVTVTPS